jgi:hypothetical protein
MGWLARKTIDAERNAKRVEPSGNAPVEVQVMGRASLDVLHARNVSTTGLGVYVPHGSAGFDLAAEVELIVTLPSVTPFSARGEIKHVTAARDNPNHFGLVFTQISDANRQSIERYVEARFC